MASAGTSIELTAEGHTSPSLPTGLLIVLSAVAVLVGVLGLVLPHLVNSRDEFAADRQAVLTRTSDFVVTFNTYSVKDWATYQKRVKPLVTPTFEKQFLEITNAVFGVVKDKNRTSGDVKVLSAAVERIDKDSAVVIVGFDTTVRNNDSGGPAVNPMRWAVSLQKRGDTWLVNKSDAVLLMQASVDDVTKGGQTR